MPALQISCAKPECHWVGAPADAATHPCPTPADGETPQTLDLMGGFEAISAWLLEKGEFDEAGEPLTEETRQATMRLEQIVAEDEAARAAPEPELALDPEPEPDPEENVTEPTWEQRIRDEIQATENPGRHRWAVIGHPTDLGLPVLLSLHAIKASADQEIELQSDYEGEVTAHRVSDLLKAAADHDIADGHDREDAADGDEAPEPGAIHPENGAPPEDAADGEEQPTDPVGEQPEHAASNDVEKPEEGGTVLQLPPPVPPPVKKQRAKKPTAAVEPVPDPGTGGLFDAADYEKEELAIPKIDGSGIDRIAIDLSGGVMLDRSNPAHVELYNRIHMTKHVELWVNAVGSAVGAKPATNRDGDLDVIVARKGLRIDAIRVVEPEQLGAVEGLELVRAAARKAARGGATHDQIEAAAVAALAELDD